MLPSPVPADPGPDEDLAWLDRDPERETWLDRAREHDEPSEAEPEEYEDCTPLTEEELAGIEDAAADELLAVEAASPRTTWCLTVTDDQGHAVGHGCARPEPRSHRPRAGPGPPGGFSFTPVSRDSPPGGYGTWRLRTPGPGPDLIVTLESLTTDPCDHRHETSRHDPGVRLRHLAQVRHVTCTSGPKCRHDHRLKQHPRWRVDQLPDGTFRWTTPAGRTYTTEPTRSPI